MLKLPYGKIYRFRCWNVGDDTQHAATAATTKGVVSTYDTTLDSEVDNGAMVFAADGDMYYDIPAEVATLDRFVRITALITTADGTKLLDTEVFRAQFVDMGGM